MTRKHLYALAILSMAIFLAYSNSINGTWAMDDIVANKPVGIKDIHDFVGFRKLAYVTFVLNQAVAPFSPANFRLFNILIHILNTTLVYVLAYLTISRLGDTQQVKSQKQKDEPLSAAQYQAFHGALLSGVLFGLHPININAVAYIVQRMASLATLFVLLALLLYIFAVQSGSRSKAGLFYALSGISVIAGIFSKENAVMALPLILLYDFIFLAKFKAGGFRKRLLVIVLIGVFCLGPVAYLLKFHLTLFDLAGSFVNVTQPLSERGWTATDVYWTPLQHILTEFRVISRYMLLILLPLPRLLVFDWWSFPVSKGITEPVTTLFSILLAVLLLIFSIWKIKRLPLLCFGILWYLSAISLESFFALGSDLYFEHRNYLPATGLFIGIAGQIVISLKARLNQKVVFTSIVICGLVLGLLTFSRNFVWKDSVTLWGDTLKKAPANIRAMMALGNAYFKLSDLDNAERYYKEVVRISSKDKRPHFLDDSAYSLGMVYLFNGRLKEAKDLIDIFKHTVESYRPEILNGFYKALNNDIGGALRDYNSILGQTKGIDSVVVLTLMGDAYREKGLWDKAIEKYGEAISLDPGFSAAYYGTGVVFMNKRDIVLAREYFEKTLLIDPDNVLALSDMADLTLIRKENPQGALNYARRAVSKNPSLYQPYYTMGNVLIVLGREQEADEFYKKAAERGVADYMIPFGKARAYYMKGDEEQAQRQLAELRKFRDLPDKIKGLIHKQP